MTVSTEKLSSTTSMVFLSGEVCMTFTPNDNLGHDFGSNIENIQELARLFFEGTKKVRVEVLTLVIEFHRNAIYCRSRGHFNAARRAPASAGGALLRAGVPKVPTKHRRSERPPTPKCTCPPYFQLQMEAE